MLFLCLKAHVKRPPAQGSGWSAFARETQFAFSPDESIWDKGSRQAIAFSRVDLHIAIDWRHGVPQAHSFVERRATECGSQKPGGLSPIKRRAVRVSRHEHRRAFQRALAQIVERL